MCNEGIGACQYLYMGVFGPWVLLGTAMCGVILISSSVVRSHV